MSTPILATKLYIPPSRPQVVVRPRLLERLNAGLNRKLTLISAPAGFGKSTLVGEWITVCERPVAWLSLDQGDNDPARFLTYLVAAVQTVVTNIGVGVLRTLQSPQPPSIEVMLTTLLNEITTTNNFILVLDDYHVIDAQPIDSALVFLLDHMPAQMHLVIITREDPQLPLARLRAKGQLTELRAVDLRFTPTEAADFLNQVMGLNLLPEDIAALETRTEGWVVGLQLAALALQGMSPIQGHNDTHRFIKSFTGSHRFVLDYLVEEVLLQQSERIQTFLLNTSILDRLCGSLCEAVMLDPVISGQEILEYLEHANLFVIPLDNERRWYRYHHLFAELLQQRLQDNNASPKSVKKQDVAELHSRAGQWYTHNGSSSDAIRHTLAAKDFERAADLVERGWPTMHRRYFRSAMTLGWMQALPDELIRARPVLSVGYAWELLNVGELEAAEIRLRDAEWWLRTVTEIGDSEKPARLDGLPAEMVVVDPEEFRTLPASIASARAYQALALDDVPGTVMYARRALNLFPARDPIGRGPAASLLGLAYWASGDLEAAYRTLADGMASFQIAGNILFAISGTYGLADIRIAQGRLHEAISTYERALQLALAQGEPALQGTADLYLGLSGLYREQGDLDAARAYLSRSEALGEQAALPDWPYRLCLAQARMKQVQGDLDGTLELLNKAERLYIRGPVPDVRPIAAMKARVWVVQGKLTNVLGWVRERSLSVDDKLRYLREFEHITLVRVLIAQHKHDPATGAIHAAMGLLKRLIQAAEVGGRIGSVIEILVLQALAHMAQADIRAALVPLEQALSLAEPEGYVRIFVDAGQPMATLLQAAAEQGVAPNYLRQLQMAFGKAENSAAIAQPAIPQPLSVKTALSSEPLSERELDVLRLLRTDLAGPEIARELQVSLNTMRTHTKNIFSKLRVNNRRAAVRRAQELDLL